MTYDEKRIESLNTNSSKSQLSILNSLRSRINFFGVFRLYDEMNKVNISLKKEDDNTDELFNILTQN